MECRYALPILLALLMGVLATCLAQAPAEFTPPGPNLALNKPYTLQPAPNYGDCSLDPQHKLLTDGVYTTGHFWVSKTTVGWVHQRPVVITIDLGQVEPIAGLSYNTAAGAADVAWPISMLVLTSDDGKQWTAVGDIMPLLNKRNAPPEKGYRVHRFVTDELQARGRYVAIVVEQVPYMVVDEIGIYRGPDALLTAPLKGTAVTMTPLEYQRSRQVITSAQARMTTDLDAILKGAETAGMTAADQAALQARADKLRAEIAAWETVPADFKTILPLNDLHARVYALHAPVLRARGYKALTAWGGYRYDPLQPLTAPAQPPAAPPTLSVRMMRNEHRAEVLNLTNPTDAAVTATIKATGLGNYARALSLREVLSTDTRERIPVSAAILARQPAEQGLRLTIPPGITKQVWLDFDTEGMAAGDARATVAVSGAGNDVTMPLTLHVANFVMPAEFSTSIGGWDETNNKGGYQVTAENMLALIKNLRDHGVNTPWSNPGVMPTPGEYDAAGNMTAPPNFAAWDEWVERWKGAPYWALFPNVRDKFADEPMGTPRFNKMIGAWVTAWVEHAAKQGIKPDQILILLIDECRTAQQDQHMVTWAKALHAAQPDIKIYNDPIHKDPAAVIPEFYTETDVLCPNAVIWLREGKTYQDFMVARQQAGCELWFYSCSGPSKLLDPTSYYRGQFWLNLKYGGKGSHFWAFGDESNFSWNAYIQARACYSPLFISPTEITDGKQMEAIREGAQDVEYFVALRAKLAELEKKGLIAHPNVIAARKLVTSGPDDAIAVMGGENMHWSTPKDRAVMDRLRLQALDLLEKLSK